MESDETLDVNIDTSISEATPAGENSEMRASISKVGDTVSELLVKKRRLYMCGTKFKSLADIPTWPEYAKENSCYVKKIALQKPPKFPVRDDLNHKVSIFQGDITSLEIDCIANAANSSLMGGGGVDGAIHRAAGIELKAECATLGGCPTGSAKLTNGYNLPAKYVLHTVGPIGENPELLQSCYMTCLYLALENNIRSIAFPCISTGIYGYPNKKAGPIALRAAREFLEAHCDDMDRIIFCIFLPVDLEIYSQMLPLYFPIDGGTGE